MAADPVHFRQLLWHGLIIKLIVSSPKEAFPFAANPSISIFNVSSEWFINPVSKEKSTSFTPLTTPTSQISLVALAAAYVSVNYVVPSKIILKTSPLAQLSIINALPVNLT